MQIMLKIGVIEKSKSDWRSPVFLVLKADGTVRFCVDFHKVNSITKFKTYQMPVVDKLLELLGPS